MINIYAPEISYRTPLIRVAPGAYSIHEAMVANALWAEDLSAGVPELEPAFRALLGPPPRGAQWDLAKPFRLIKDARGVVTTEGESTCGLVGAGLLDRVVSLPWHGYPYWEFPPPYRSKDGSGLDIVSCLSLLGLRTNSRRPAGQPPQNGDLFCIGTGYSTHVGTAIDNTDGAVTSIDGGQVDTQHGGLQCVRRIGRIWKLQHVNWVIDIEKLARAIPSEEWIVPLLTPRTVGRTTVKVVASVAAIAVSFFGIRWLAEHWRRP